MDDETKRDIQQLRRELENLFAENLATQAIVVKLAKQLSAAGGAETAGAISQAFDEAADFAEHVSIVQGRRAGHVPETLRIIEQLRMVVCGPSEPKKEV